MSEIRVRVERNRYGKPEQPWLVKCRTCHPPTGDMFATFFGHDGVLGWARTWRAAQDYAARHALNHEKTRCPTCLHVPPEIKPDHEGVRA